MKLFSFKKKKPSTIGAESAKKVAHTAPRKPRRGFTEGVASEASAEKSIAAPQVTEITSDTASVIIAPRVTEKGTDLSQSHNSYVFMVRRDATKKDIAHAVRSLYKVTPIKVRTVPVPTKQVRGRRGEGGVTGGGKKAYVYLKKGDTIEFV